MMKRPPRHGLPRRLPAAPPLPGDPAATARTARDAWRLFGAACLLALCALAPAIFPYGGRMVTRGDFMEQQIPFILETRRMLRSGVPLWDWNSFLGANFLGSYAFYTLGSPFVWLLVPLPEAAIPYGISVMAVLKHAVAAVTAFLYLRRFTRESRWAQAGALLYAFSGFSIINTQFYHFMDVVAVFPLLLCALEGALTERRRWGMLALACALNATVNYYFFWNSALFVVLYAACRLCARDVRPRLCFRLVLRIVCECALGSLMAAWLLFPAAMAALSLTRTSAEVSLSLLDTYTLSKALERLRVLIMPIESGVVHAFYGDAASWSSTSAYLPLVGIVPAVWFFGRRPKGWLHALLAALVLASLLPAVNRLFTLGANDVYTRWWYAFALALCVPAVRFMEALPHSQAADLRRMRAALFATLAVTLVITLPTLLPARLLEAMAAAELTPLRKAGAMLLTNRQASNYAPDAFRLLAWGLTALNSLALLLMLYPQAVRRLSARPVLFFLPLAVTIVANYAGFIAVNDTLVPTRETQGYTASLDYYAHHVLLAEQPVLPGTTYDHRVDAPPKLRNYGMQINRPSITQFHSLRSHHLNDFVYLGGFTHVTESPDIGPPDQQDGAIRALLGVRTYYNYDPEHYQGAPEGFAAAGQVGTTAVYHSESALPLGFAYDCYTTLAHVIPTPDTMASIMLRSVILRDADLDALRDRLPHASELPGRENLPWREAAALRAAEGCYDVAATPRGLTAKIDLAQDRLVCFTTSYDEGWSATVDGQPATLYTVNLGMLGVWVPAGQGIDIVLTYWPRGLTAGLLTSALACAAWGAIMLCRRRRHHTNSKL